MVPLRPTVTDVGEWVPGEWTSIWYEQEAQLPIAISCAW